MVSFKQNSMDTCKTISLIHNLIKLLIKICCEYLDKNIIYIISIISNCIFYVIILDNDNDYMKVEMRKRFDLFHYILFS